MTAETLSKYHVSKVDWAIGGKGGEVVLNITFCWPDQISSPPVGFYPLMPSSHCSSFMTPHGSKIGGFDFGITNWIG